MSQKLIDEIGNKYGLLTVLEKTKDKNNRTAWLCQCECGNTKIVRGSDLRKGRITTCGYNCQLKQNGHFRDLTNQKFGRLIILNLKEINKNHKTVWHCRCDCGNECDILSESLINGSTRSCGCLHREQLQERMSVNMIGRKIGKLTVIEKIYDDQNHIRWKCQCDCGNYVIRTAQELSQAYSCGCVLSRYESEIYNWLLQHNINFKKEQSFDDLVSPGKKRKLRYDFSIKQNNKIIGLIEFQGDQHFQNVKFWGDQKDFDKRILHDKLKKEYAINHNIPILYLTKKDDLFNKIQIFLKEINYYNEI